MESDIANEFGGHKGNCISGMRLNIGYARDSKMGEKRVDG